MTFKERFQAGECSIDTIEDWVQFWHEGNSEQPLSAFLGLSEDEYSHWIKNGHAALARQLSKDAEAHYMAFHLEWTDLAQELSNFVLLRLGAHYTISVKRSDFYFWDLVIHSDMEIDEQRSKQICEQLGLVDVDVYHFLDSDTVDQNQMRGMLEELFQCEIISSHADDEGVWFFHKALYASSKEWIAQHIARFEQRLRMEIKSKRYPATTRETAAHQLYGFVKALLALGLVGEYDYNITLEHFADTTDSQSGMQE